MLVLSSSFSGCTSSQSAVTTVPTTPPPAGGSNVIVIKNFAFSPAILTIKTRTTVTWLNQDEAIHQIASDSGTQFSSDSLANGGSYQFTFTKPGTYTYHCSIHPSMKGTIIVQS